MTEEGVIKFKLSWQRSDPPAAVDDLIAARQLLYNHHLIGCGPDGIGFGNISRRSAEGFVITGSGTGCCRELTPAHITTATGFNIEANSLNCSGPIQASSESLTHAALYQCCPSIMAVAHAHCREFWHSALFKLPTTSEKVPYGTPEMAREMERLYQQSELPQTKVLIMAGHQDGVISFGGSLAEAADRLLRAISLFET